MSMTDSDRPGRRSPITQQAPRADTSEIRGFTGPQTIGLLVLAAVLDTLACLAITGHARLVGAIILSAGVLYFVGHGLVAWSVRGCDEHCRRALHDAGERP